MKKRILQIVLNGFTNDSRVLRHSLTAIEAGYDVEVLALHQDDLPEKEIVSGIPVTRIRLRSRDWPRKLPTQIFKYLELSARALLGNRNFDIIHCNDLEPLALAILLKKTSKKTSILYDSHELQTERSFKESKTRIFLKATLEKNLIRHIDEFTTVSPLIAEEYAKRYSIPPPKVVINCPPLQKPEPSNYFRSTFDIKENQKIFIYQGLINEIRGSDKLIKAFSKDEIKEDVALVLLGHGQMILHKEPNAIGENVFFHPAVPYNQLISHVASADYGLVTIENNCLSYDFSMPNKLFECAMAGLPVLSTPLKQVSELWKAYPMGVFAASLSEKDIADGVKKILKEDYKKMSEASLELSRKFNWDTQKHNLLEIYAKLA